MSNKSSSCDLKKACNVFDFTCVRQTTNAPRGIWANHRTRIVHRAAADSHLNTPRHSQGAQRPTARKTNKETCQRNADSIAYIDTQRRFATAFLCDSGTIAGWINARPWRYVHLLGPGAYGAHTHTHICQAMPSVSDHTLSATNTNHGMLGVDVNRR